MVFPTFFNLSLNFAIRSSWHEPQSAAGLVFTECIEHLHLWQRISSVWFWYWPSGDVHVYKVIICVVGRVCLLWPVCSLGKTLLAFVLLHFVLQGQSCLLLQVSPDFQFCNEEFIIWVTVSSQSCFCWLYRDSPSSAAKNIISLISVLTVWWCPCLELSRVLLEECVWYDQCSLFPKLF